MLRVTVSVVLLCLELSGLGHAALSVHAWDDSGVAYERESLLAEGHEGDSHVCADLAPTEADACAALAVLGTPTLLSAPLSSALTSTPLTGVIVTSRRAASSGPPLLLIAPKSSPPLS